MKGRETREMWGLKQAWPVHSILLDVDMVDIKTNEAKQLLADKGVIKEKGTFIDGDCDDRKYLVILHGGTKYGWISGYLDGEKSDPYPTPPQQSSGAETVESVSPTRNIA